MPDPTIPDFVRDDLARLGIEVPAEMLERLARYLDLLLEANQSINLTAVRERDAAWRRHIVDSLTLLPLLEDLPEDAAVIDVGSGGGLPGVPVAITRPDLRVTLLEATGKKARFLDRCVAEVPLPGCRVLALRAETAGQDPNHRQSYDAAICRAVGPMSELLEYALPLVRVGGRVLAMKGPSVPAELEKAADALAVLGAGELQVVEAYPEGFGLDTVVVSIAKDQPTPREFPRSPGTPRHEPL